MLLRSLLHKNESDSHWLKSASQTAMRYRLFFSLRSSRPVHGKSLYVGKNCGSELFITAHCYWGTRKLNVTFDFVFLCWLLSIHLPCLPTHPILLTRLFQKKKFWKRAMHRGLNGEVWWYNQPLKISFKLVEYKWPLKPLFVLWGFCMLKCVFFMYFFFKKMIFIYFHETNH